VENIKAINLAMLFRVFGKAKENVSNKPVVLDTSALVAFIQNEAGADRVEEILKSARNGTCEVYISFITLAEMYYVTWQEEGRSAALEMIVLMKSLSLNIVESMERLTLLAGSIKANHRLSLADAFIAATASHVGGILIHKDPEIEQIKDIVSTENLPYKSSKR
jgi:predicted nucleic acid-binding protein